MSENLWWYILYGWLAIVGLLFLFVLLKSEYDFNSFHNKHDDR